MITKQVQNGNEVQEVDSNLSELEDILKYAFSGATCVKQVFETMMTDKGMSMHSVNTISIDMSEISHFNDNLVINVNKFAFSMAIKENCNIVIQLPQPDMKCRIYFKDFQMWLILI